MNEHSIFGEAIGIADVHARAEFVKRACGRNDRLGARVEQLLKLHDNAGSFLEHQPLDPALQETVLAPHCANDDVQPTASDRIWLNLLSPSDLPGAMGRMGEYDILSIVGRGGMGVVYRAQQRTQRWIVAIKMIGNQAFCTPDTVKRLENEAEAASRLQHKNIVSIHEFGEFQGLHYYSMEYVDGRTLDEVSAGQPLHPEQAARYAETIATAIHYAHREGVLHRDLKPANIMIDQEDCVRITDFGLAKLMDANGTITETGQILGTASYMSPEQASARHADIGPCSDIYSIGAILYELLTGQAPIQGDSILEILRRVCEQPPVPPREINPRIPENLERICLRCLQKDISQRYASADELAQDLHRFRIGQPVLTPPVGLVQPIGPMERAGLWLARNRVTVSLSAAIVLLGCAVVGMMSQRGPGKTDPRHTQIAATGPIPIPPAIPPDVKPRGGKAPVAGRDEPGPAGPGPIKDPVEDAGVLPAIPLPKGIDGPPDWIEALMVAESPKANVTAKAIAGEPFGVAEVVIQFDPKTMPIVKPDDPVWITENAQRVLYPVVVVDRDNQYRASRVTVRFLFQGKEDLHLIATAVGSYPIKVAPERNGLSSDLLGEWWKDYSRPTSSVVEQLAGHDMLRNYLTLMLSRRLELKLPKTPPTSPNLFGSDTGGDEFLHLLLGTSSIRVALQKDVLLNVSNRKDLADSPLPKPVAPPPVTIPPFAAVPVEPIAEYVPEECFYVRCATFADWQWFRSTLSAWGGNLSELVTQRGLDQGVQRRLEKQLALSEELSKDLFANDALAEFALIGSDTFYLEGAAIGVVLRARDNAAVQNIIERQRRSVARVNPQVQQTTEEIAGHAVSFLSTSDNSVRSFHAVDGDVHFVTTSRRLVERFFEAGQGQRSLANLHAFQYARSKFLLTRADPVFIYLSDPFFANFLSPQYRIEMTRRAQALADLELVQMARWAAIAERRPYRTVADLVTSGLLPESIQFRPDRSQVLLEDGVPTDSLRGTSGTFLPIPDTSITKATSSECAAYKRFADAYQRVWARMDPVTIALNRRPSPKPGHEEIACDVSITPLARGLFVGQMGAVDAIDFLLPTLTAVKPPAGSLLHASAELNLSPWFPQLKPTLVFLGLGDLPADQLVSFQNGSLGPVLDQRQAALALNVYGGLNEFKAVEQSIKAHLETAFRGNAPLETAIPGLSDEPLKVDQPFVPALWVRSWKTWLVAAVHRDTLQQVAPSLEMVIGKRPAQLRLTLADLEGTRWGALARTVLFGQARQLSAANPRLLHELMQQLHLECDEARPLAEELLRGKLVCPLGGDYVPVSAKDRPARWVGTAWSHASLIDENAVPQKYEAPFLHWFHGLSIETTVSQDTLTVHFELNTKPDGAKILETQAQLETDVRTGLERVLDKQTAERRRAAFHEWVNRFQGHAIVEKSRTLLPDLWQQREEEARQHLAALDEPEDEADLLRIASEYPLTATARDIELMLRERRAVAEWERLAPTLSDLSSRERILVLDNFTAKHAGTEAARHAQHEASIHISREAKRKSREDEASSRLKEIRFRHRSGYPQSLDLLLTEYSDTPAATEAQQWRTRLIGVAVKNLTSSRVLDRGEALQLLVEAEWSDDSLVEPLIKLMLEEPRTASRLDAARLVNRLSEPAWDRAARALQAAQSKPANSSRCKEAQLILRVTPDTQIKSVPPNKPKF